MLDDLSLLVLMIRGGGDDVGDADRRAANRTPPVPRLWWI